MLEDVSPVDRSHAELVPHVFVVIVGGSVLAGGGAIGTVVGRVELQDRPVGLIRPDIACDVLIYVASGAR